jgi:hypothetical protein
MYNWKHNFIHEQSREVSRSLLNLLHVDLLYLVCNSAATSHSVIRAVTYSYEPFIPARHAPSDAFCYVFQNYPLLADILRLLRVSSGRASDFFLFYVLPLAEEFYITLNGLLTPDTIYVYSCLGQRFSVH